MTQALRLRFSLPGLRTPGLWRWGDGVVALAGLALILGLWQSGSDGGGDRVRIRQDGRLMLETDLRLDRLIAVPGPLGITRVEIRSGRVRVQADPGPRQLCVRQGWIGPGGAAICLPNRVSVERGAPRYDSLHY